MNQRLTEMGMRLMKSLKTRIREIRYSNSGLGKPGLSRGAHKAMPESFARGHPEISGSNPLPATTSFQFHQFNLRYVLV